MTVSTKHDCRQWNRGIAAAIEGEGMGEEIKGTSPIVTHPLRQERDVDCGMWNAPTGMMDWRHAERAALCLIRLKLYRRALMMTGLHRLHDVIRIVHRAAGVASDMYVYIWRYDASLLTGPHNSANYII